MKVTLLLASAALIAWSPSFPARVVAPVERFTANALNVDGDEGPVATLVQIDIDRWSTDEEHAKLTGPLVTNHQSEASGVLRKLARAGAIRALDLAGDPLYYARKTMTRDGHAHIMLIGSRPLRAFERVPKVNMSAYPFSVVELDVDTIGHGTGTLTLAATLDGGPEKPIRVVPDRIIRPVRLTQVKHVD